MSDRACEEEWARLVAERQAVRGRLGHAASDLAARARDPLGLKAIVRRHPLAAAVAGAGAAALVTAILTGRRAAQPRKDAPTDEHGAQDGWVSVVRSAAVSAVVPWIARFVREKFAQGPDADARPTNGEAPRDHVPAP